MRAMILAAGLGTRLRPLTETIPKPLLPVANRPLLEYTLTLLASAGIGEVMVNTHHLADTMEEGLRLLDSSGLKIHLSRERRILGTAGGLKKASPFLENGTFLLVNGDFLIDIDLNEVLSFHRESRSAATMVLMLEDGGRIHTDGEGRIRQFLGSGVEPSREWTAAGFTGIHVLEPEMLKLIPSNTPWEINRQVYPEMLRRGWPVFGYLHRGYWREAGNPRDYLKANIEVVAGAAGDIKPRDSSGKTAHDSVHILPPVLIGEDVSVGPGARLGPETVIGSEARIGPGAEIRRSVVLAGTDVRDGERAEGSILFPGGRIDPDPGGKGGPVKGR